MLDLFLGKGAGWLVVLSPFILIFGPFLMSCYIFQLNHRSRECWHKCWKGSFLIEILLLHAEFILVDPKYDWFNCKGKGTGWSFLLIILYLLLSPLLVIFTLLTFLGLFLCSVGQNSDDASKDAKKQGKTQRNPFLPS